METKTEVPELTRELIQRTRDAGVSGPSVVIGALMAVAFAAPENHEGMKRAAAWTMYAHVRKVERS